MCKWQCFIFLVRVCYFYGTPIYYVTHHGVGDFKSTIGEFFHQGQDRPPLFGEPYFVKSESWLYAIHESLDCPFVILCGGAIMGGSEGVAFGQYWMSKRGRGRHTSFKPLLLLPKAGMEGGDVANRTTERYRPSSLGPTLRALWLVHYCCDCDYD